MGARSKGNIWVNRSCWVTSQPGRPLMDACGKGWSHTCVDKLWLRLALCEACEACSSFYPSWAALKQWGLTAVLNRHLMHIPHVLISGFMASSSPQGLFFFFPFVSIWIPTPILQCSASKQNSETLACLQRPVSRGLDTWHHALTHLYNSTWISPSSMVFPSLYCPCSYTQGLYGHCLWDLFRWSGLNVNEDIKVSLNH